MRVVCVLRRERERERERDGAGRSVLRRLRLVGERALGSHDARPFQNTHPQPPRRRLHPAFSAFQNCDLYSKTATPLDAASLKPYYAGLIEKYGLGGKLRW